MNKFIYISQTLILLLFLIGCSNEKSEKEFVIGFSQCMTDDVWRKAMAIEMNIEASSYDNITIIIEDAKENNDLQIEQIKSLIQKKVDVLIISPNQSDKITPIAEKAYESGIPTIIVDRKIDSDKYTSYVGGNSYEIGKMAGEYASSLLDDEATILEIWGTKSTSPAQERHKGFMDGLAISKKINIVAIEGRWRKEIAKKETAKLTDLSKIDLIFAHNDVMAIGAREYIMESDSTLLSQIDILGVDGAFGENAGLEAVADEKLKASFLYPTGGDQVIKIAMNILNGQEVDKNYVMGTTFIDKPTAQTLLMQSNQIINYQTRIEQQRENINSIMSRFRMLRHSLGIILSLMSLIIIIFLYIYYINRKISRRNKQLKIKNEESERQKEELLFLNEKIKEANEQKMLFFMNVSHEVKTPLTLIVSPLEKWIKKTPETSPLFVDLIRMKKNTDRLMRVIDQLLDFRKIENKKIKLNLRHKDIVGFVSSVKSLFDGLAESKNIEFSFSTNVQSAILLFDEDKMEKALVNLLSNAFKFTNQNGNIEVILNYDQSNVTIAIHDNGIGIDGDKTPYIFDRFYSNTANNKNGTGIGLHLSQEFVKLHGGSITVKSIPKQETIFTIRIPISSNLMIQETKNETLSTVGPELPNLSLNTSKEILSKSYNYTILIVEDNIDILEYLVQELSEIFRIVTAKDGVEALRTLNDTANITLVLSDVLMPKMNGFELCRHIKESNKLSDIPVILLTALSEIDQRIYGIAEGADDYIQKPFIIDYVKIKIISLLENRKKSQKRFMEFMQTGKLPILDHINEVTDRDQLFMNNFNSVLETSYNESNTSIEKISQELNVSRVHLYRKVKEISGLTPVDYLRNFRLNKALELLKSYNYSISEVAYQTGFSSPAYFAKCFKDVFNMTPSEYIARS